MDAQKKYRFSVAGGDMRNADLAELLAAGGHDAYTFALGNAGKMSGRCSNLGEAAALCDILICPIPFSTDGIYLNAPFHTEKISLQSVSDILRESGFGGLLIGGRIPQEIVSTGVDCVDILMRDDLAILNSVPTAEGALQIAMEELPYTVHGIKAVVCGMGRVGSALARLLVKAGADVTVSVRSSRDAAVCEAECIKSTSYEDLADILPDAMLVYNTVPARVIDSRLLDAANENALFIDLASAPGGIDFDYAASRHLRVIHALSLPGKVAPAGAAQILQKVIFNVLREKNM